jgi:hypothetical protein
MRSHILRSLVPKKGVLMLSQRLLSRAAVFLGLIALIGCSKRDGTFATVSGVVTYNGNPVEGARVVFNSTVEVNGKQGATFGAQTDSSGKYLIAAVGKEPGIPPGLYKVTVVKWEGKGPAPTEDMDSGQLDAMLSDTGGSGAKGGPVNLLPKEYATVGSSKLSATLEAGKNENVNFALKGK